MRCRPARLDRGGSVLEYAVVLALVAVITVLLPVTGIAGNVGEQVRRAFCAALQDPAGCRSDTHEVAEIAAACPRHTTEERRSLSAQALVYYRGDTAITRTEWADGSVWFTAQPWRNELGAGAGVGGAVDQGKTGTRHGWYAQAGGAYQWGHGLVWTFGPDKADAAAEFEEDLASDDALGAHPGRQLWRQVTGQTSDLPEPDIRLTTEGVRVGASAATSTGLLLDSDGGASSSVDIGMGLATALEAGGEGVISVDDSGPETRTREAHNVSGSISADGEVLVGVGAGLERRWSAGIESEYDAQGRLRSIRLRAQHSHSDVLNHRVPFGLSDGDQVRDAGADATHTNAAQQVRTVNVALELTTETERELGAEFLRRYSGTAGVFRYFWTTMLGQDTGDDAWEQLVQDRAHVWETVGERTTEEHTLGGSVSVYMIPFGAHHGEHTSSDSTTHAWYLTNPIVGQRAPVAFPDCADTD